MSKGSKSKYTPKQKRTAAHIEEGYEKRGAGKKKAQRIAWATVNKEYEKAGTDRLKTTGSSKKGQKKAQKKISPTPRSLAAKKAWVTRRKNQKKKTTR